MQDGAVKIPYIKTMIDSLYSIDKTVSARGNVIYTASRNADGHADEASGLILANHAYNLINKDKKAFAVDNLLAKAENIVNTNKQSSYRKSKIYM
jgi:phage FluMu gp28-like protein